MSRTTLICLLLPVITSAQPGSLDLSYGTGGWVSDVPGASACEGRAIALAPDGSAYLVGGCFAPADVRVLHWTIDGQLDQSYGTNGVAEFDLPDSFTEGWERGAAVLPDGKLLIAGSAVFGGFGDQFTLVRLQTNGDVDSTFGTNGVVQLNISSIDDQPMGMLILSSGKILLYGFSGSGGLVVRLNEDATFDATFSGDGRTTIGCGFTSYVYDAVELADGRVVVAGECYPGGPARAWAGRLLQNGFVDPTFPATPYTFGDGTWMYGKSIDVTPTGGYVLSGYTSGTPCSIMALGLSSTGALVPSFGTTGAFRPYLCGQSYGVHCSASDGSIRVIGDGLFGGESRFMVSKLFSDGQLDPNYVGGGTAWYDAVPLSRAYASAVQADGKLLVAGDNNYLMGMLRVNDDISTSIEVSPSEQSQLEIVLSPSDNRWYARMPMGRGTVNIELLDAMGRICTATGTVSGQSILLPTDGLRSGQYIVRATSASEVQSGKLMLLN